MATATAHKPAMGGNKLGFTCECGQRFITGKLLQEHINDEKLMATEATAKAAANNKEAVVPDKTKAADQPKAEVAAPPAPEPKPEPITEVAAPPAQPAAPKATSKVQKFLDNADVRARFENLLDKRAGQFITSLTALVSNNSKLAECTPNTFLSAAITAAALDLPVNPNLGFAYIIPYSNKGVMEAQFQMGYKGFIQLAQRSGQYKTISATPVYEGQLKEENPMTGNAYDWKAKKSDKVIGYVAYFKLQNGFEKDMYMSLEEMTGHGRKYSQSFKKGYGLWKDEFDTMATKTVLKLLISKYGPLSTDTQMAMAIERDQAVVAEEDANPTYVDNIGELQLKINEAKDAKELQGILAELTAEEKVAVQPLIEARLGEL